LPTSFPTRRRRISSFTWVTGFSPYLGSERQAASRREHLAGRWAERELKGFAEARQEKRELKGFAEAREALERMLQERYAPRTQTLTQS